MCAPRKQVSHYGRNAPLSALALGAIDAQVLRKDVAVYRRGNLAKHGDEGCRRVPLPLPTARGALATDWLCINDPWADEASAIRVSLLVKDDAWDTFNNDPWAGAASHDLIVLAVLLWPYQGRILEFRCVYHHVQFSYHRVHHPPYLMRNVMIRIQLSITAEHGSG